MVTPGKLNRRAEFFDQLATMIAAGVPLTKAMEMAGRNRSLGVPRRVVEELTHHLQDGHTFTDAMQLASGQKRGIDVALKPSREYWLSDFDVALLSAGEESGRLDTTFRTLARYNRSRAQIIRDTVSGSLVTIVTLHVFLLVFPIGYLQQFVLGIINNQYHMCLPFILEKAAAYGLLYGAIWFLTFSSQGHRGESWRSAVEAIFNLIPWLRQAVKYLAVARLSMALEALLSAGVPVIRSWELAAASCGSPQLKKEIFKWAPQLESGTTPGDMVAQIPYFPETFTQLYQTGELSGKMDETLVRLHTYFEEEGFHKLKTFCRVLGYAIYFTIVVIAGIFIIRFWTLYFAQALGSF
ncbi:MAG: type II secretion system F family protein [Verrucomicrobiota bacterium]|jgi:type II secretory pathway component PulF